MVKRAFEKISKEQWFKDTGDLLHYDSIKLPKRGTKYSAGYDIYAPYSFEIPPNGEAKIATGLRAYMHKDEVLMIYVRSSAGFKYGINLKNNVGIVDADYVFSKSNEGHIWAAFRNTGRDTWYVNQGDAICQAIFTYYLVTDDDETDRERNGGIGSTT
jgi:dUTP pyrophosphatase